MRKWFILILFFIISIKSIAQEYTTNIADSLISIGNISDAIKKYKICYNENIDNELVLYKMAVAFALNNQVDSSFSYLKLSLVNDSTAKALTDPFFIKLINDVRWDELERNQIKKIELKFGKLEGIELSRRLWKMLMKDQAYYYHLRLAKKIERKSLPIVYAIRDLKEIYNKENIVELEKIIKQYGWPKKSFVGESASLAAFLVLQHSDISFQKKYFTLLECSAKNGELNWSYFATLIDRINISEGRNQIYGTQMKYNEENSTYELFPIENEKEVDVRRKDKGLQPLKIYLKKYYGIDYKGK